MSEPSPVSQSTGEIAAPVPDEPARTNPALVVALVALTLFGVGILASQFSYGRVAALTLSGLGTLTGIVGLLVEGRARLASVAAITLNLGGAGLLLLAPSWLGLLPWEENESDDRARVPQAVEHGTGISAPADWVDAEKASWGFGDVRVSLRSAGVAPIELAGLGGKKQKSRESYLKVTVRMTNEGVHQRIDLGGWALGSGTDGVRLSDSAGKAIKSKAPSKGQELAGRDTAGALFPGKSAEVVLLFEVPASRPEFFRLELPGAAVGSIEPIRFRVPGSFVTYRRGG